MIRNRHVRKVASYTLLTVLPLWLLWGVLGLVAGGEVFSSGAGLALLPSTGVYSVGKVFSVDVVLTARDPINVAGVTLEYPADRLDVIDVSKRDSILNLWIEEPEFVKNPGVIHFSGGISTHAGYTGDGKLATVLFRVRDKGEAQVNITEAQVFAHDGVGTDILVRKYGGVYTLSTEGAITFDLDGNGAVDMQDVGVFVTHWGEPYHSAYDLNRNGKIDIGDLSLLVLVLMRSGKI